MGVHGGAALVPEDDLHASDLLKLGGEGLVQVGPGALGAVHIPGEAHNKLVHLIFLYHTGQLLQHHLGLSAVDGGGGSRQKSRGIGESHAGMGVAVVNGHDPHRYHVLSVPSISTHYDTGKQEKLQC